MLLYATSVRLSSQSCRPLTSFCVQAAVQMEIEDINAYCQRQDALAMLKRMPAARRAPVPAIMESEPASNYASGHACDGPAVA